MNDHFGGDFSSTNLDLLLASAIALGLPFAAAGLLTLTGGAAASLVLYYGVCCVFVVRWRKGTLDYRWPHAWPWCWFVACLLVPLAITAVSWGAYPQPQCATFRLSYHFVRLGLFEWRPGAAVLVLRAGRMAQPMACRGAPLDGPRGRSDTSRYIGGSDSYTILGALLARG